MLPLGAMGIRAWPEQNFLFEILMSMQEGEKWIYNHFIQLRGTHYINRAWNKTDSSVTFYPYAIHYLAPNMFDLCPFVEKNMIPKSLILGIFKISQFCDLGNRRRVLYLHLFGSVFSR